MTEENTQQVRPMGEIRFTSIGSGFVSTSAKGTKSIRLSLDPEARKLISDEDFKGKIYIFKSAKLDKNNNPIYQVSAPMPAGYQRESKIV